MTKIHRSLDLRGVMIFMQAARDRSFTAAADRLGMTPSAVSKAIARLEDDLGVELLRRNPRSVSMTPAGAQFLEEAERLTIAVERARQAVATRETDELRPLRVALPIAFGQAEIAPQLPLFIERHPSVKLEYLLISNGQIDPIEHQVDVALLVGGAPFNDARLVCDRVADADAVLCASPAYIERFGTPDTIAGLDVHRTMGPIDEVFKKVLPWRFLRGGKVAIHTPRHNVLSNSIGVLVDMALADSGIVMAPYYLVSEAIRRGQLQIVLGQHRVEPVPIQIVRTKSRADDPEVIAFVNLLHDVIERRRLAMIRTPERG